jgi:DNA-binding IclR family transcriptional regulator
MVAEQSPVEAVVAMYDSGGEPVTVGRVAAELGTTRAEAETLLERLSSCGFVTDDGGGYRPTVTAREFLSLEGVDGPVIVDAGPTVTDDT